MDDSLRRWCLEAVGAASKQLTSRTEVAASEDGACQAERIVNLLAFRRLLEVRNFSASLISRVTTSLPDELNGLFKTCPLIGTDSAELLGSIHEYLVTRRTSNVPPQGSRTHRPRKSGGVFYTPGYVVDEIVGHTLGQKLVSLPPSEWSSIRILDPAAGCGAFLVRAFQLLIQANVDHFGAGMRCHSTDATSPNPQKRLLPFHVARRILVNQIFGVDVDTEAVEVLRRILWLTTVDSCDCNSDSELVNCFEEDLPVNLRNGNSVLGEGFERGQAEQKFAVAGEGNRFDWWRQFPQVCQAGGFDLVIGNPPYRREKDFKEDLGAISDTELGRRHRTARMDLWYYFLHRGIELLNSGGTLSFITTAYWLQGRGAESVISTLRDDVRLDELFLLRDQPVFQGVTSQHVIFRVTKTDQPGSTVIRVVPRHPASSAEAFLTGQAPVLTYVKSHSQLFREGRLDVMPAADELLDKFNRHPRLGQMGDIRQGIAENPASINRRTMERFPDDFANARWRCGEGVFSLVQKEVDGLSLGPDEARLLRPYHDLCDLDRYWAADTPSRHLIYSTKETCPQITDFPNLHTHLRRFQAILEARRETRIGANSWWHLHWPRSEEIWRADKLLVLQMAPRPSVVPMRGASYVPFSVNVVLPAADVREDLRYLSGLMNSRPLWGWFVHHAKRRGIGLELNGHVLKKCPIRRIDFDSPADTDLHDQLVDLVDRRLQLANRQKQTSQTELILDLDQQVKNIETQLDSLVAVLYGLTEEDISLIEHLTDGTF